MSGSFQQTFLSCTKFASQLKQKYYIQKIQFVDDTDMFTSFLFNVLGTSYQIKLDLNNMVEYDKKNDVKNFWTTFGGIMR